MTHITQADGQDRGATPELWPTRWEQISVPADPALLFPLDAKARTQLERPDLPEHMKRFYRAQLTAIRFQLDCIPH